jgi:O-antigen/teichoic acid export membrane protein
MDFQSIALPSELRYRACFKKRGKGNIIFRTCARNLINFLKNCPVNREFILNILFLVFVNLLIKPFFIFGIDLGVQNRVGSDYGLYFTLLFIAYIFQIVCDFGIQQFNNAHVSRHPVLLAKYFPNLLALKLGLSAVYMLVAPLVAWLVFGYGRREIPLLMILLLNQALVQMIFFLRSNISGLGHYRLDSVLSSLDKFLMLFTCGFLLWGGMFQVTIETFSLAQTLALFLTALAVFALLKQKAQFPIRPSWAKNWRTGLPVLFFLFRKSAPYALAVFLMTVYTRLDVVLLERLLPDGTVHAEVYAGAYRLLDACNMFGYLFASLLLPMFARLLKKEPGGASVRSLAALSFQLIWAGSVTLAAAVFFARADLVQLMMPERADAYRADTLGLLIWAFVPVSATYIFATLLTAGEQLAKMNRWFLAGIALDAALNLLLIPHWKASGSALAALITQVFIAAAMTGLAARHFKYRPDARSIARIAAYTGFAIGAAGLIFSKIAWSWPYKFALALLVGAAGAWLFRLVDFRKMAANATPEV